MTIDRNSAAAKPSEGDAVAMAATRPRKTRRGKKRRQERPSDDSDAAPPVSERPAKKRRSQIVIRPRQVPKAPANFTQFIIDDHESCALYQSFEGSLPLRRRRLDSCEDNGGPEAASVTDDDDDDEVVPESSFPAGEHYESLDYGNIVEFYEKDFEAVYNSARVEELLRLPRSEMIEMYWALERRAEELCDQLHHWDPLNCLDELQRQLLRLQEENQALLRLNASLAQASAHDFASSSGLEEEEEQVDQEP